MAKKQVAEKAAKTPPPAPKQSRPPITRPPHKPYDPKDYDFEEEPEVQVDAPESPSQVAEPEPASAASAPAPAKQSPYLLRMAQELNLREDDIAGLTNDELSGAILLQQRRVIELQESERRLQPRGPLVNAPVATPPEEDDLGLDPDVHESIAAAFKRLAKENRELKASMAKGEEREQQREVESRNERIDRAFRGMPELAHVYGKGDLGDLTQDEWECRDAVIGKVIKDQGKGSLEQKIQKHGRLLVAKFTRQAVSAKPAAPSSEEPAYEQPAAKVAPATTPTNGADYEDEELAKRRAVWNASTVAEPTARKGAAEPKGITKAKKTFIKGIQEIGMGDNQLSEELTAELPD